MLDGLRDYGRRIDELTRALEREDAGFLARWIAEAAGNRRRLLEVAYPVRPRICGRCGCACPTAQVSSPASSMRWVPTASTSRTSSCTTSRPRRGGIVMVTIAGGPRG